MAGTVKEPFAHGDLFIHSGIIAGVLPGVIFHIQSGPKAGFLSLGLGRAVDASALAGIDLHKAVVQLAFRHRRKQSDALLDAVYGNHPVIVAVSPGFQAFQNTAGHRVHSQNLRTGVQEGRVLALAGHNTLFPEPLFNILKGQHRVHVGVVADIRRLVDFSDARAYEHYLDALAQGLFNQPGAGNHGRHHRGHIFHNLRMIQLDQTVDRGAAGGDDVLHLVFHHQVVILGGDYLRCNVCSHCN